MHRAARGEIDRLRQLRRGAELQLLALAGRGQLTAAEQTARRGLEQRALQLHSRIEWFEALLRERARASG